MAHRRSNGILDQLFFRGPSSEHARLVCTYGGSDTRYRKAIKAHQRKLF
jgi:hypothetical protein